MKEETLILTSAPEQQGIRSESILDFLNEIEREHIELNALLIMRHNTLVFEGYWEPFRRDLPHRLFSAGKAVIGIAVLFAIQDGHFSLDSRLVELLRDKCPDDLSDKWNRLTVYDMLTMHSGHKDDTFQPMLLSDDRIAAFFQQPLVYEPGTHFLYNNGIPDVLAYLVLRYTGLDVLAYFLSRLQQPLDLDTITAAPGPLGIEMPTMCTSARTLLKLTMFLKQKGRWNGVQLLDETLAAMATAYLVPSLQEPENDFIAHDTRFGYGFQIWRNSVGGFRIDGGRGQFGICLPEQDMIIAVMANEQDQNIIPCMVWKHLTNRLFARPIISDGAAARLLEEKAQRLSWALQNSAEPEYTSFSSTYLLKQPLAGISRLSVRYDGRLHLSGDRSEEICCGVPGSGEWVGCGKLFDFQELHEPKAVRAGLPPAMSIHAPVPGCDAKKIVCSCACGPDCVEIAFRSEGWLGGYVVTLPIKGTEPVTLDTAYSYNIARRSRHLMKDAVYEKIIADQVRVGFSEA